MILSSKDVKNQRSRLLAEHNTSEASIAGHEAFHEIASSVHTLPVRFLMRSSSMIFIT